MFLPSARRAGTAFAVALVADAPRLGVEGHDIDRAVGM